jgi:O-antigen ligase
MVFPVVRLFPWLIGLGFLGMNAFIDYTFYRVNNARILSLGVVDSILFVSLIGVSAYYAIKKRQHLDPIPWWALDWKIMMFFLIPILGAMPGLLLYGGQFNVDLLTETTTQTAVAMWAVLVFLAIRDEWDVWPIMFLIGCTILYTVGYTLFDNLHGREYSTFGNANYFSGFLLICTPLFFTMILPILDDERPETIPEKSPQASVSSGPLGTLFTGSTQWRVRAMAALVFCGALFGVMQGQSRAVTAILALTVVLSLLSYLIVFDKIDKKTIRLLLLVGAAIIVILVGLLLWKVFIEKSSRVLELFSYRGWFPRFNPWFAALSAIKDSPIFGYGLGSSYNLYFLNVSPETRLYNEVRSYKHVHNEPLEVMEEGGLFGIILLIAMWYFVFRLLVKMVRNPEVPNRIRQLLMGIGVGFVGYHIHSFFTVSTRMMAVEMPVFLFMGVVLALYGCYFPREALFRHPVVPSDGLEVSQEPAQVSLIHGGLIFLVVFSLFWQTAFTHFSSEYYLSQYIINNDNPKSKYGYESTRDRLAQIDNVYTLSFFMKDAFKRKDLDSLSAAGERVWNLLPYYRETRFLQAVGEFMQKNWDKATTLFLDAQSRDRYYLPGVQQLMNIGVITKNYPLFFDQFITFTRRHAYQLRIGTLTYLDDLVITDAETDRPLRIVMTKEGMGMHWNRSWLQQLLVLSAQERIPELQTAFQGSGFFNDDAPNEREMEKRVRLANLMISLLSNERVVPSPIRTTDAS